jgi:hypothetical protein
VSLRDEVRDPWTYVLGGLAGGAAWAVGLPGLAIVGVAGAVALVRGVVATALGNPGNERSRGGARLPVAPSSPEQSWLDRGQRAVASFRDLARSLPSGIVSSSTESIASQADETLEGMRRLAGQASVTAHAASRLDIASLQVEAARLQAQAGARDTDPDIAGEAQRSLDSVQQQLDIAKRLQQSRATLLARMESGALGLERLVAQLSEILALSESATSPLEGAKQLEALADDLEGLRAGLAETEQLSRRALSAYEDEGTVGGEPAPRRPDEGPTESKG